MARTSRYLVVAVAGLVSMQVAAPAWAAVSVSRAELDESELRVEGTASAGRDITVDGVVMGRSDTSGSFRIQRDPYSPPADCTVDVGDGSATVTPVRLSGCTVTETPPPPSGDTTAPSVPANLAAALTANTVDLTWTASTDEVGVVGYRVSRNDVLLPGTPTGTSFTDPDLAAGTYSYTVVAIDAAGNVSGASNSASVTVPPPPGTDTTAPSVPPTPTATVVGTTISLSWGISSDDTAVVGYRIVRNGTALTTTADTTYVDSGLAAGTYTYTVSAFDAAGNTSAPSTGVTATVQADQGLYFITPAQMPDATLGQAYLGYIVASDPAGPSTFKFKLVSGKVPDGTRFSGNTLENRPEARVTGTPSRTGSFSFTVEVRDNTGATARRTFTITVVAGS